MFCSQFDTHLAPILWTSTHWTPTAKVICLHESTAHVVPVTKNRVKKENGACIRILDTVLMVIN